MTYTLDIIVFPRDLYRAVKKAREDNAYCEIPDLEKLEGDREKIQKQITNRITWNFGMMIHSVKHCDGMNKMLERESNTAKSFLRDILQSNARLLHLLQLYPDYHSFDRKDIETAASEWNREMPQAILENIFDFLDNINTQPVYSPLKQGILDYFCPPQYRQTIERLFTDLPTLANDEIDRRIAHWESMQPDPQPGHTTPEADTLS